MTINRCPTCKEFIHNQLWHVVIPPDDIYYAGDADPTPIRAHDARAAAIEFIRQWDKCDGDYVAAAGETIAVLVSPASLGAPPQRFTVTGEWDPHYTATEQQSAHSENPCSGDPHEQ